ncbi:MtrB/PioB family decaheme-associated outer membrane protein [Desulfosarcina sp.]|uniref:MtrB/PioB family decaheme-associated outer membrane protein n=1 Tax=Desulfosarcina sp. TaxID=2027861 RepID=UPI0035693466
MKRVLSTTPCRLVVLIMVCFLILPPTAMASETTINNIREGLHPAYTRIVFDCSGKAPEVVGPAQTDFISLRYAGLEVIPALDQISGRLGGAVDRIELREAEHQTEIRLSFKAPGARVKSMMIPSASNAGKDYRLVLDIYAELPATKASAAAPATEVAPSPVPQPAFARVVSAAAFAAVPVAAAVTEPIENRGDVASAASADMPAVYAQSAVEPDEPAAAAEMETAPEESQLVVSGEASLILRSADREGDSAKFEEYRDITAPVSGNATIDVEKDRDYYLRGKAEGIGQDDQWVGAEGGRYGKFGIDATWDKIIHRYGYDARTLFSGVGSGYMTLDDNLQADIQSAPNAGEVASRLDGYLASAVTGDPDVTRDQRKLGINLLAFDPFTLRVDLANEKREGTRPFAGAFNSSQMVELFEPVDYDTTDMKIIGEYALAPFLLNVAYQYSQFKNNEDTLRFDNPLRATDAVGGPSNGTTDLAPDNQYHNLNVNGALTHLPWRSQITASAAWGRMTQDDALVPFTSNTAITAPALPAERVDARVDTSLYKFRFTSKPLSFMRVKGSFRYYDYDNRTGVIDFPDGYVETDDAPVATAIRNLPTSYTQTQAGADVGFDVFTRSNLTLGYQYEKTDRTNREVAEQEDHIMKASLDTRALDWLDLRTSYARTERDIGDYRYDVYLDGGQDLAQLPQLRKYDQADLTRDFVEFLATVYPTDALALSGSVAYGTDDFHNSPYGLIEDNRYVFSFDTDYTLGERLTLNLFYTHEIYQNEQRARQNGGVTDFDWTAEGQDLVDTLGGGFKLALIRDLLDLDLIYAFSDFDGNLEFSSPAGSFDDFSAVDDTKTHMLNTKLVYHNTSLDFDVAVGYLWEKFDYSDFAAEGFSYVPTDTAGNYQGALLAGTLPQDYDAHVIYTRITFRYH